MHFPNFTRINSLYHWPIMSRENNICNSLKISSFIVVFERNFKLLCDRWFRQVINTRVLSLLSLHKGCKYSLRDKAKDIVEKKMSNERIYTIWCECVKCERLWRQSLAKKKPSWRQKISKRKFSDFFSKENSTEIF